MNRRKILQIGGAGFLGLLSGCLGTVTDRAATESPATTETCTPPADTDLVSTLPPAFGGLNRTVDDNASDAYLDEYEAIAAVSAEYTDGDDEILDDLSLWAFRFRRDAKARRILVDQLNDIEFDSGRVGVSVLVGRVGLTGAAPKRRQAHALLARSSALSEQCLEAHTLLPSKTRTPNDETPQPTVTVTESEPKPHEQTV